MMTEAFTEKRLSRLACVNDVSNRPRRGLWFAPSPKRPTKLAHAFGIWHAVRVSYFARYEGPRSFATSVVRRSGVVRSVPA